MPFVPAFSWRRFILAVRDRHCAYHNEVAIPVFWRNREGLFSWRAPRSRGLSLSPLRAQRSAASGHVSSARAFNLATFLVGQVDDDGVFIGAKELGRVIVGIADD